MRFVSFSQVELFMQCERKFFWERVMTSEQKESSYLTVGKAYHETLEASLRGIPTPLPKFSAEVEGSLATMQIDRPELDREVEANMNRLRAWAPRLFEKPLLGPEHAFKYKGLGYRGVIDLVCPTTHYTDASGEEITTELQEPCVVDWKSLTSERRRSYRDVEYGAQPALYAIAAGVKNACIVEIPRDLKAPIKMRTVTYTEEDLAYWTIWLKAAREAILSRGRSPRQIRRFRMTDRKNPLCSAQWCAHYFKCYPVVEDPHPTP